jgi:hypothetical protein
VSTYQITATEDQDAALAWVAGDPNNSAAYLQARNSEILDSYVAQHNLATAPVPTKDVAAAYAYARPEQQAAVVAALGLEDPAARAQAEARALGL